MGALTRLREGTSFWNGVRVTPRLDDWRQSNVPGVYVVGDLGDAPIIKGAILQGWETGKRLAQSLGEPQGDGVEVVIVGGGPAGVAAAMALHEAGRRYVVLERDHAFHTIDAFPQGKVIYADPAGLELPDGWAFDDAPKEALVAQWTAEAARRGVELRTGVEVVDVDGKDGAFVVRTATGEELAARKVVLAIGRRGTPRPLDVPGGDAAHVRHDLTSPKAYAGKTVVVIGGGDSAVETALLLARAGAHTTLAYRGERLDRPKKKNRDALEAAASAGQLHVLLSSNPTAVGDATISLKTAAGPRELPADAVFAMIGTLLPTGFLDNVGVREASDPRFEWARLPWVIGFIALTWCFYVLKQHRDLFPFHHDGPLGWVPDALTLAVPAWTTATGAARVLGPGFWATVIYTLTIAVFGVRAMRRYPSAVQRRRYASLIAFQVVMLFGVPEVLAPLIIDQPWKAYSLGVPWPLSVYSLAHGPAAWGWLVAGALVAFVAIPLYVWRSNESFCSYLCGCGGLAETLGDAWRWRAPRGDLAKRAEGAGRLIMLLAVPVTALILVDAWGLVAPTRWLDQAVDLTAGAPRVVAADVPEEEGYMRIVEAEVSGDDLVLGVEKYEWDGTWQRTGWIGAFKVDGATVYPKAAGPGTYTVPLSEVAGMRVHAIASTSPLSSTTAFAQGWYALIVDFGLASVLGVALYPLLGNRVWCRFFCPLRAYMELLAKRFGRLAIRANDKCISCGECTRYCQMGIDVEGFASQQLHFDNANSACIQCGICVEVCPVDCLDLVALADHDLPRGSRDVIGPRWGT